MSNKKHVDAYLEGYDGPFFPASVDDLRKKLDQVAGCSGSWLHRAAKIVDGYVEGFDRPTTSDGYCWFWSMEFARGSGSVVILIPWSQDWDGADGTQSDRGIAVYTKETDVAVANDVVQQYITAVELQKLGGVLDAMVIVERPRP